MAKVEFDGPNRVINVLEGITELDVQIDLYSGWKNWSLYGDANSAVHTTAYLQAFSVIGGDPITETQNLGSTYFLENGWRIQPFPSANGYVLTIKGNLYTRESNDNPMLYASGVMTSMVRSNLIDLITIDSVSGSISNADIEAIASVVTQRVWDALEADHQVSGSFGKKVSRIATKVQDIALR